MTKTMKVPCDVYSRIVGYYAPTRRWNKGKRQEFEDRQAYDEKAAVEGAQHGGLRDGWPRSRTG